MYEITTFTHTIPPTLKPIRGSKVECEPNNVGDVHHEAATASIGYDQTYCNPGGAKHGLGLYRLVSQEDGPGRTSVWFRSEKDDDESKIDES